MNRAAQRLPLYTSPVDFEQFIKLLRTFTGRTGLRVAAYCVMPNHYHALVQGKGEQLTRCFHEVDRLWALALNERRGGRGHVFQGPFLSFLQHSAGWAVRTSVYIHLNPLRKPSDRPQDYPWSNYGAFFADGKTWTDPEIVLRLVHPDLGQARSAYRDLVEARRAVKVSGRDVPEEEAVRSAAAQELAAAVPALAELLRVHPDEARRLAAWYGRMVMGLSQPCLAMELGYPTPNALAAHLSRLRLRLKKEPGFQDLVRRAGKILSEPPVPVTNQTL
jgi:REP element-mobilizing transposase RayT